MMSFFCRSERPWNQNWTDIVWKSPAYNYCLSYREKRRRMLTQRPQIVKYKNLSLQRCFSNCFNNSVSPSSRATRSFRASLSACVSLSRNSSELSWSTRFWRYLRAAKVLSLRFSIREDGLVCERGEGEERVRGLGFVGDGRLLGVVEADSEWVDGCWFLGIDWGETDVCKLTIKSGCEGFSASLRAGFKGSVELRNDVGVSVEKKCSRDTSWKFCPPVKVSRGVCPQIARSKEGSDCCSQFESWKCWYGIWGKECGDSKESRYQEESSVAGGRCWSWKALKVGPWRSDCHESWPVRLEEDAWWLSWGTHCSESGQGQGCIVFYGP